MEQVFSYTYSIPYIAFFVFLLLVLAYEFELINRKQSIQSARILCILGFLFFFGLRGFVYTDWFNYYPYFEKLPTISMHFEPGFNVYSILIKSIYPDYFFWQFISSLTDVLLLNYIFKRYSRYYTLGFVLFFLFGGTILEINLMRNIKSVLLFICSIQFIEKKQFIPYLLINLLGFTFHFTALLYIPLYFILNKRTPRAAIWIVFIVGNLIYLLQLEYIKPTVLFAADLIGGKFADVASGYLSNKMHGSSYGITIGYIERFFSFILFFCNYERIVNNNPKYGHIFLNSFLIYFICNTFMAEAAILIDRIGILFIFSYWILYPELFSTLKVLSNKAIFIIILFVYGSLKMIAGNNNIFNRYENILFEKRTYQEEAAIINKYTKEIFKK